MWGIHIALACLVFSQGAFGQTLASLLDLARSSEPTYLGVKTNVMAAKARVDQAFGVMLPQVSLTGSTNAHDRNYNTRDSHDPSASEGYNSNSAQVSLTQPIWRYANIVGWRQAKVVAEQSEYQLAGAEQELLAKLVEAWFNVLAARDEVAFTTQQAAAQQFQLAVATRGGELGASSWPQLEEARAKLDQALADVAMAESEAQLKRAELEQLVGPLHELNASYMRGEAVLASPTAVKLDGWLQGGDAGNPNLLAAMRAYEAAEAEVSKQRAGHYPTLDLVASYGKNSQSVGGFPGQSGYDIKQGTMGLELSVPIFSGGTQSAKVVEALAQQEKARLEVEMARRTAVLAIKQAWFTWHSAQIRTLAGIQAIRSAHSTLAQAQVGTGQGLKTRLDILQAEQQLRAGQRDFRKGRYDQVVAYVKLKAAVGSLTEGDVAALDALLVTSPEEADPEMEPRLIKVRAR